MNSKFLGTIIILTFVVLVGAAVFQFMEMQAFGLPETLKERFFPTQVQATVLAESSSSPDSAQTGNPANETQNPPAEVAPAE